MTAVFTVRDETAGVTTIRYHYTRVVETAGRIVRARVERDRFDTSLAVAEVLTDQLTWTQLAKDDPSNWWYATPVARHVTDPATVLGPLADRLLHRAAAILTPPSTPRAPD
jgi:hypothetical protein